MIKLHRLNGSEVSVNAELVEVVEAIPDTSISLVTGNRLVVKETVEEVTQKILDYRKKVNSERTPNPIEGFVRK